MAQFETDLTTAQAKRFDKVLEAFVVAELVCRPDVDVQTTSYSREPGIERRWVFLSDETAMAELRLRWEKDLQLSGASVRKTISIATALLNSSTARQ